VQYFAATLPMGRSRAGLASHWTEGIVIGGLGGSRAGICRRMLAAIATLATCFAGAAAAQTRAGPGVEIAVSLPLTGEGHESFGQGTLDGIQLAVDEANVGGAGPHIDLKIYDDKSSDDGAKEAAAKIAASRAVLVLGPSYSTSSLAAGPIYAQAGMASLCPTATSDAITDNATTFRMIFKNSQQGEALALYLARVLRGERATVIVVDNKYGRTLETGFQETAQRLGIEAHYFHFKTADEAEQIARQVGADKSTQAVVFLTLDPDAARMLAIMRRAGLLGPFLGGDALGDDSFSALLAGQPEEAQKRGFFTDNVYGVSPMILDSANAEILAFAERFRARFHHDPIWMSVAGYDAARMAIAAARATSDTAADTAKLRAAALKYLGSLNGVENALPGLLGPLWFDESRGGQKAIRIGRFNAAHFESAPLQIVPVSKPDMREISSGAVFELGPGRFARLQRVVYSGVFINEIPRVDLTRSSFGADFYLWLRYARDAGPDSPDPTDIIFPNLMGGSFDRTHPAEQGVMADGTEYRLWRVQGEFRNDFDLRRFPFDRQTLSLSFSNARAAADRIVYVLDKRSPQAVRNAPAPVTAAGGVGAAVAAEPAPAADRLAIASATAFRNLTQWSPLSAGERRDNLVTDSALGDPRRVGAESYRELSGFLVTVDIERRAIATLMKTLLPLMLMTFIMFASLYFPAALVKEKVTVAITGALSGAVLLAAINSQLGGIGYTVAVEYAFYIFFCLSLLCIVSVLAVERLRAAGQAAAGVTLEHGTRGVFLVGVGIILVGALVLYWAGR
jgi:ABC-type branched-subunit amino acid transport system substrate-binding protein